MLGLIIGLIILGLKSISGSLGMAVVAAGHFMWHWYWIFAIVKIIILAIIALIATGFGGLMGLSAGLESKSKLAAAGLPLLGIGAGASLSLIMFALVMLNSFLLIMGSYLLMNSFAVATGWSIPSLVVGAIFILIGVFAMRSSKSS